MGGLVNLSGLVRVNLIVMLLGNKVRTHRDKVKS